MSIENTISSSSRLLRASSAKAILTLQMVMYSLSTGYNSAVFIAMVTVTVSLQCGYCYCISAVFLWLLLLYLCSVCFYGYCYCISAVFVSMVVSLQCLFLWLLLLYLCSVCSGHGFPCVCVGGQRCYTAWEGRRSCHCTCEFIHCQFKLTRMHDDVKSDIIMRSVKYFCLQEYCLHSQLPSAKLSIQL